jgi:hypothetical protein
MQASFEQRWIAANRGHHRRGLRVTKNFINRVTDASDGAILSQTDKSPGVV